MEARIPAYNKRDPNRFPSSTSHSPLRQEDEDQQSQYDPITTRDFSHKADYQRNDTEASCYAGMMSAIGDAIGFFGSIPCLGCCCPNPYITVNQGTTGLITTFGKYKSTVNPGLYYVNIVTEKLRPVDVKLRLEDISKQSVVTKDNVTVVIDSVLYWHVVDPYTSVS
jgi:erythrocyte band 7 integral membrane protein